ncbi:MAG: tetratricopeptide repeat protein [Spirochaetes bacterium]|nr:tetratricopeptide repeat protein [Spirochaetota bacterium]
MTGVGRAFRPPVARVFRPAIVAVLLASALACARSAQHHVDRGNTYFAQQKWSEAILEYRAAIVKEPRLAEARDRLAAACERARSLACASRESIRAADLLPARADAQIRAGRYLLMMGLFTDARSRAERALTLAPDDVHALVVLGHAIGGLRDLDTALNGIQEAIRLDPDRSRVFTTLPMLQFASGNLTEAEATIRRAIGIDPRAVDAHLALANVCWSLARHADTEAALLDAHRLDPSGDLPNRALATFYISAHRPAEAERHLKALVDATGDAQARLSLADYYALNNRHSEALAILESLATKADTSSVANVRIASIEYADNNVGDAHRRIDRMLSRDPNNVAALVVKGRFLLAEDKIDDAVARLKTATTVNPRLAMAQFLLGTAYARSRERDAAVRAYAEALKLNPRLVAAQIRLAELYLEKGMPDAAIAFAVQAVRTDPDSLAAHIVLVRGLLAGRDYGQAETELKELLQRAPAVAEVHASLGTVLRAKRDLSGARKAYERAIELDRGSYEGLAGLVTVDLAEKKVEDARARVSTRLLEVPVDPGVLLLAARTYGATGDVVAAERLLLRLIDVDPSSVDAYGMLGRYYLAQGRLAEARVRFEDLVRREPGSVPALTMLGSMLQTEGKTAEARRRYEQALAIDPRAAVASNNLAGILADSGGNLDVALQLAQTAREQLSESAEVDDTLGRIYLKKGLLPQAVGALEQAVAADSSNPKYVYHLGLAYAGQSQKQKARAALERALKLSPNFEGSAEARRILSTM